MKAEARLTEHGVFVVSIQAETSFEEIALMEFDKRRKEDGAWGLECVAMDNLFIERKRPA